MKFYDSFDRNGQRSIFVFAGGMVMKISPSFEDIRKIAAGGEYKVLPVSCEILSDICTPIEASVCPKRRRNRGRLGAGEGI